MANTRWPTFKSPDVPKDDGKERRGGGFDLQHGNVGARVAADEFGLVVLAVEQRDLDLPGAVDDVIVGQDVALLCPGRSRSLAPWRGPR